MEGTVVLYAVPNPFLENKICLNQREKPCRFGILWTQCDYDLHVPVDLPPDAILCTWTALSTTLTRSRATWPSVTLAMASRSRSSRHVGGTRSCSMARSISALSAWKHNKISTQNLISAFHCHERTHFNATKLRNWHKPISRTVLKETVCAMIYIHGFSEKVRRWYSLC